MNPNYNSDYEIRLAELGVLGGDTTIKYDSVYSIDLAILARIQGGGIAQQVIDDNTISTSTTYSSSKIVQILADAGFRTAFVDELPASGDTHTIYFIPSSNSDIQNVRDEYMWTGSAWEQVGSTTVDLSDYYNKSEINDFLMQAANEIEQTNTRIDNLIDDSSDSTNKTLSSSKILELVGTLNNTINNVYENAQTIDFKFGEEYEPAEIGDKVVYFIDTENQVIYEYKGEELGWEQLDWDASALYFDTENGALYAYNTEAGELIEVTIPNTFIVNNLNTDTKLKTVKTAGTYNVIEHLNSTAHGSYLKNWVMTVTSVDYDDEDYQTGDKWYQVLENNVTIKKRTWSATRQTNDGWSNFATYYKGEIKDTNISAPSKYYTYSQLKTEELLDSKQDVLTPGNNIEFDEDNIITAKGYWFNPDTASITVSDENNEASGVAGIAAGYGTKANGYASFADGAYTNALGNYSVALGYNNTVSGAQSIAVGRDNTVSSNNASGFGSKLTVSGKDATATNRDIIAAGEYSFVHGYCNIEDTILQNPINNASSKYLEIVGNGGYNGSTRVPSNAYTLDWTGIGWYQGDVTCGGADGDNPTHSLSGKQNILTAGSNINITNDTVSAKGYVYNDTTGTFKTINVEQGLNPYDSNSATGKNSAIIGGEQNTVSGTRGVIIGGQNNIVSGKQGVVISGTQNNITGIGGVAIGGQNVVSGSLGMAIGSSLEVQNYQVVVGKSNISDATPSSITTPAKNVFIVGIGDGVVGSATERDNALTVGYDGKTWSKTDVLCGGADVDSAVHSLSNKADRNITPDEHDNSVTIDGTKDLIVLTSTQAPNLSWNAPSDTTKAIRVSIIITNNSGNTFTPTYAGNYKNLSPIPAIADTDSAWIECIFVPSLTSWIIK